MRKPIKKISELIRSKSDFCIEWPGHITEKGYARVHIGSKSYLVHRLAYEQVYGSIPEGMVLDHLCRNTKCINPNHLEAVTTQENIARGEDGKKNREKTHCPEGHAYSLENTSLKGNRRACKTCARDYMRKKRWQKM